MVGITDASADFWKRSFCETPAASTDSKIDRPKQRTAGHGDTNANKPHEDLTRSAK